MSLLLHLSDLHLTSSREDLDVGDFKAGGFLHASARPKRFDVLRKGVSALHDYLTQNGESLDAIVVSGDVANRNDSDGFKRFEDLLGALKDLRPGNDRIVVVPGNHDVKWEQTTALPDEERYKNFISYIRNRGYVTPLLDGIDFDPADPAGDLPENQHLLVDPDREWMIIPVNSSHFCGRLDISEPHDQDKWKQIADTVGIEVDDLRRRLNSRGPEDIARITPEQLERLAQLLQRNDGNVRDGAVKIAVLHHHLHPVTVREEFKPFESLSNLAALRNFLRSNRISVVLHGHKHAGCVYWDHIYNCETEFGGGAHEVVVVAAPALDPRTAFGEPFARLIRVQAKRHAPSLSVAGIIPPSAGSSLEAPNWRSIRLWQPAPSADHSETDVRVIQGKTIDETYAKLQALFDGRHSSDQLYQLITRIEDPSPDTRPPEGYPEVPHTQSLEKWFCEMVEWWQRPQSALQDRSYFTHGSRIKCYGPDQVDQLQQAIDVLRQDQRSSRAVMTLLMPAAEAPPQGAFPSFCQLQFLIREHHPSGPQLECIAYFRKQEMRYWWPINVAEITRLLQTVHTGLRTQIRGLAIGAVTTISAMAHVEEGPPRVAIPLVDRLLDLDEKKLWRLAASLFWDGIPKRAEVEAEWNEVLQDLAPAERYNPDGVPVATGGLQHLLNLTQRFLDLASDPNGAQVRRHLQNILYMNTIYLEQISGSSDPHARHEHWRTEVTDEIGLLRNALADVYARAHDEQSH